MAQPGPAPEAAVYPINVHWTQAKGWWFTPDHSDVPLNDTVRFNTDRDCTICFSPNDTVFGASQDVSVGTPVDVPVGNVNVTVDMCATTQGSTCNAGGRKKDDLMGTIKVGSGGLGRPK
jgi:hypothetical protein